MFDGALLFHFETILPLALLSTAIRLFMSIAIAWIHGFFFHTIFLISR